MPRVCDVEDDTASPIRAMSILEGRACLIGGGVWGIGDFILFVSFFPEKAGENMWSWKRKGKEKGKIGM